MPSFEQEQTHEALVTCFLSMCDMLTFSALHVCKVVQVMEHLKTHLTLHACCSITLLKPSGYSMYH